MAKVMLATGSIVAYGYTAEVFFSYYSGNPYERYVTINRALGPTPGATGRLIACNIVTPQVAVVPSDAPYMSGAVRGFADRQRRHVAGAVRDRGHQPASRLSAIGLANVLSDACGTSRISSARSDCF